MLRSQTGSYSQTAPWTKDEGWLNQRFDAAGIDPMFAVRRTDANVLVLQLASNHGWSAQQYAAAEQAVERVAPRTHRAEADARYWAALWQIVASEDQ